MRTYESDSKIPLDAKDPNATSWAAAGVIICVVSLFGLAGLQYLEPIRFAPMWGELNHAGIRQFQRHLFGTAILPHLSASSFALLFRVLLCGAWCGYALAIIAGLKGGILPTKRVVILIAGVAVVLAVIFPPSLSTDSYASLGFARLKLLYGLNPYVVKPQTTLRALGDPVAPYLFWDGPTAYGPLWSCLTVAIVAAFRSAGLWGQVVALKLVAAGAVVLAALAGRKVAGRLPDGKGNLTLLAIGLNPLLLIEGPGNAHNDALMIGLMLLALAYYLRSRLTAGMLILGLSISVKYMTAAMLPLLVIDRLKKKGCSPATVSLTLFACLLSLVPVVLFFIPFWQGSSTFSGLSSLPSIGYGATEPGQYHHLQQWFAGLGVPLQIASLLTTVLAQWRLLAVFLGLMVWVCLSKGQERWAVAWIIFGMYLLLFGTRKVFPWYMIWPFAVSLLRWSRTHIWLSGLCFGLSVLLTMLYTV